MRILLPSEAATFDRAGWAGVVDERAAQAGSDFVSSVLQEVAKNGADDKGVSYPYKQAEWIHACVYAISLNLSSLPLVVETGGAGSKPVTSGPVFDLFEEPASNTPKEEWIFAVTAWFLLYGEAFLVPYSKGSPLDKPGIADDLAIAAPTAVRESANNADVWCIDAKPRAIEVARDLVIHPREFNPYSRTRGLSKVEVARAFAEQTWRANQFNAKFLKNGADPGGWLTYKQKLNQTQRNLALKTFDDKHAGESKAGKTALFDGDATFTPNPRTHRDMEFLEGQKFNRDVICAIFGVPKTIVSVTDSINFATKVAEEAAFWERAVLPIGRRLCGYINLWLRKVAGVQERVRFDHSQVEALQDRVTEKTGAATALAGLGVPMRDINTKLGLKLPEQPWYGEAWAQGAPVSFRSLAADSGSADPGEGVGLDAQQLAGIQAIVLAVSAGTIPADSAAGMLTVAFPTLTPEQISAIITPAGQAAATKAKTPEPAPTPPAQTQTEVAKVSNGQAPEPPPVRSAHVRIIRPRDDVRALRTKYAKTVVLPHERKVARVSMQFLRQCKSDVLKIFDSRDFSEPDLAAIEALQRKWDERIRSMLDHPLRDVVEAAADGTAEEIGITLDIDLNDPRWIATQKDRLDKLAGVNQTTIDRTRSTLLKGLSDGQTNSELRQSLLEIFSGDYARSLRIARTEVGALSSTTRDEVFAEAEVSRVEWVSAHDDIVRDTHREVDGEVVDRGKKFSNGLRYPHDPFGGGSEVINCRCDHVAAD